MLQLLDYLQLLKTQPTLPISERILIQQSLVLLCTTFRDQNVLSQEQYRKFVDQEMKDGGNGISVDEINLPKEKIMAYLESKRPEFMAWKSGKNSTLSNTGTEVQASLGKQQQQANPREQVTMATHRPQLVPVSAASTENALKRQPGLMSVPDNRQSAKPPTSTQLPPTVSTAPAERNVPPPYRFTKVEHGMPHGGYSSGTSAAAPVRGQGPVHNKPADEEDEPYHRGKKQWKGYQNAKQRNHPYGGRRVWGAHNDEEEEEDVVRDRLQSPDVTSTGAFRTAHEQLLIQQQKKNGQGQGQAVQAQNYGSTSRSLGTRRDVSGKFVPPIIKTEDNNAGSGFVSGMVKQLLTDQGQGQTLVDERLKNIEPRMIEIITSEIMDHGPLLSWDDIAGLEFAKKTIREIVIWPMLRPDIFHGLRGPPKGLLLFGPPGTGKTLIGKCIASQSKSTFFSISASSLTSKWVGEGEKMVRALFAVARVQQPSVIFIDEIDSLLSQRSDSEHESSRRIKTEFLVQLDGATTSEDDRILVIGATNRPQELDEAARRRFVKRLYIPLPEAVARTQIVVNLLKCHDHDLSPDDLDLISQKSEGYSGSDMANLCREAALGPIRAVADRIDGISLSEMRPIQLCDFEEAFKQVRASVSSRDLDLALEWNKQFGSWGI